MIKLTFDNCISLVSEKLTFKLNFFFDFRRRSRRRKRKISRLARPGSLQRPSAAFRKWTTKKKSEVKKWSSLKINLKPSIFLKIFFGYLFFNVIALATLTFHLVSVTRIPTHDLSVASFLTFRLTMAARHKSLMFELSANFAFTSGSKSNKSLLRKFIVKFINDKYVYFQFQIRCQCVTRTFRRWPFPTWAAGGPNRPEPTFDTFLSNRSQEKREGGSNDWQNR